MTSLDNIRNRAINTFGPSLSKLQNALSSATNKISEPTAQKTSKAELSSSSAGKSDSGDLVKPGYEKTVGHWLLGIAALVFGLICIGAYTRLLKFGHSFTGMHPLEWKGQFDSLQKYVEHFLWKKGPQGFTMIFLEEYLSTILEKVIGFCFIAPFSYFFLRGILMPKLRNRCLALIAMQFLQGYIGAWMAVHELRHMPSFKERNIVGTHRLFVHWNTTMIMFAVMVWNALSLLRKTRDVPEATRKDMLSLRTRVMIASGIHAMTFAAGVMVAGIDGSKKFNTFPTMDGHLIPNGYLSQGPIWRDIFENIATVQFHHRILAVSSYATAAYLFAMSRKMNLTSEAKKAIWVLFFLVNMQLIDGLTVLFTKGHWLPGTMHQSIAIGIIVTSLFISHAFLKFELRKESEGVQQAESTKISETKPDKQKKE